MIKKNETPEHIHPSLLSFIDRPPSLHPDPFQPLFLLRIHLFHSTIFPSFHSSTNLPNSHENPIFPIPNSHTNIPTFNPTTNLFHPLRHQQSIPSHSRLTQFCPLYSGNSNSFPSLFLITSTSKFSPNSAVAQSISSNRATQCHSLKSHSNLFFCNITSPMLYLPIHRSSSLNTPTFPIIIVKITPSSLPPQTLSVLANIPFLINLFPHHLTITSILLIISSLEIPSLTIHLHHQKLSLPM